MPRDPKSGKIVLRMKPKAKAKTAVDKKQNKQLNVLNRLVKPNMRRYSITKYDLAAMLSFSDASQVPATLVQAIAQGDALVNNRIGNEITYRTVSWKLVVTSANTGSISLGVKYFRHFVLWSPTLLTHAQWIGLYAAAASDDRAMLSKKTPGRSDVQVLHDKIHRIGNPGADASPVGTSAYNGYPEFLVLEGSKRIRGNKKGVFETSAATQPLRGVISQGFVANKNGAMNVDGYVWLGYDA